MTFGTVITQLGTAVESISSFLLPELLNDFRARWPSLREAIAAKALPTLAAAAKTAKPDIALADVELLPTIPNPDKILCIGLNYASHVGEVGRELPKVPSVFSRLHNTLVAQGGKD